MSTALAFTSSAGCCTLLQPSQGLLLAMLALLLTAGLFDGRHPIIAVLCCFMQYCPLLFSAFTDLHASKRQLSFKHSIEVSTGGIQPLN
jgi:hypothetical protein